jgi:hypothetical protein
MGRGLAIRSYAEALRGGPGFGPASSRRESREPASRRPFGGRWSKSLIRPSLRVGTLAVARWTALRLEFRQVSVERRDLGQPGKLRSNSLLGQLRDIQAGLPCLAEEIIGHRNVYPSHAHSIHISRPFPDQPDPSHGFTPTHRPSGPRNRVLPRFQVALEHLYAQIGAVIDRATYIKEAEESILALPLQGCRVRRPTLGGRFSRIVS